MITEDTKCWWHGCWEQAGHFLFTRSGWHAKESETPLSGLCNGLDTGYAPRRHKRTGDIVYTYQCGGFQEARSLLFYASEELPMGQFLRHYFKGRDVTFLSWWDRAQGDTRGNCNSCFLVQGEHSTVEMLEWFPKMFPIQAGNLERGHPDKPDLKPHDGVTPYKLVEVLATPTIVYEASCASCKKVLHETRYPSAKSTKVGPHRAPDWQPSSPDYCKGSGVDSPWVPTTRRE